MEEEEEEEENEGSRARNFKARRAGVRY
jgi:hypothetical protein